MKKIFFIMVILIFFTSPTFSCDEFKSEISKDNSVVQFNKGVDFGVALQVMKQKGKVKRLSWKAGTWLAMYIPNGFESEGDMNTAYIYKYESEMICPPEIPLPYGDCEERKEMIRPYIPTYSDMLSENWIIIPE